MDPGTATIAAAGISTLGSALGNIFGGNKQQQKPYRDPNEDYLSLFGPILSAENTEMTAESRKAAVQDTGELAAAAMVGGANQGPQVGAINEAIAE